MLTASVFLAYRRIDLWIIVNVSRAHSATVTEGLVWQRPGVWIIVGAFWVLRTIMTRWEASNAKRHLPDLCIVIPRSRVAVISCDFALSLGSAFPTHTNLNARFNAISNAALGDT